MYGNYGSIPGYQPVYQPSFAQQMHKVEVVHVNGRPGAEAYQIPPNSNALLLDDTSPIVWLVQTDGAGYKTCSPYSISPYKPEATLEDRIKRLEDIINESNTASYASSERKQPQREAEHDQERDRKRSSGRNAEFAED